MQVDCYFINIPRMLYHGTSHVLEVLQHRGVARITADQCQLGQEAENGEPVRKLTGFMTNARTSWTSFTGGAKARAATAVGPKAACTSCATGRQPEGQRSFSVNFATVYLLIGLRDYSTRHRRMKNNEQFYTDGCGIMIDGDDDVRLHYRND